VGARWGRPWGGGTSSCQKQKRASKKTDSSGEHGKHLTPSYMVNLEGGEAWKLGQWGGRPRGETGGAGETTQGGSGNTFLFKLPTWKGRREDGGPARSKLLRKSRGSFGDGARSAAKKTTIANGKKKKNPCQPGQTKWGQHQGGSAKRTDSRRRFTSRVKGRLAGERKESQRNKGGGRKHQSANINKK